MHIAGAMVDLDNDRVKDDQEGGQARFNIEILIFILIITILPIIKILIILLIRTILIRK